MKVLMYGGNGWIGRQLNSLLETEGHVTVVPCTRAEDAPSVHREIETHRPTHVVSLVGRTYGPGVPTIDYLEQDGKLRENVRDNLLAPVTLAMVCAEHNVHFTYLGTGCIFDGPESTVYSPDARPNFFGSSYSTVKGATDELMHLFPRVLNLRIRMPITACDSPRNLITKLIQYDRICSVPNSMSVLPTLLPVAVSLMEKQHTGTVNLVNPGVITHDEILRLYQTHVDATFRWKNMSIAEQDQLLAARRSNNALDTAWLSEAYPALPDIRTAVSSVLREVRRKRDEALRNTQPGMLLVTGGAGFIGSHFVNAVYARYPQCAVLNVDALRYCGDHKRVDLTVRGSKRYLFAETDLSDLTSLTETLLPYMDTVTHVVHFAAQSHVDGSFTDALDYTRDNVVGTHNLLELARRMPSLRKFIHVSTDEVYGESGPDDTVPKTEMSVLTPTNPYAATKAAAELIARAYATSFDLPVVVTRGNNVYGPGQYSEKLIPRFINLLADGKKLTVHGDGTQQRGFMYVSDAVAAFITVLEKGMVGKTYNIGCDQADERSVNEVAALLVRYMHGDTVNPEEYTESVEDRPFNDKRYFVDSSALHGLGWRPHVSFEEGIFNLLVTEGHCRRKVSV